MVFFLLEKASKLCRNRAETCCAAFTMCFSTISQMICGKPRVYNRGLVLARLQMQLQDVGPLKLPWSDCMLGPGQKVTASWFFNIHANLWTWNATCHNCHGATVGIFIILHPFFLGLPFNTNPVNQVPIDITQSEPGEWHGHIRIRGSWVTRIDLAIFFISFDLIWISNRFEKISVNIYQCCFWSYLVVSLSFVDILQGLPAKVGHHIVKKHTVFLCYLESCSSNEVNIFGVNEEEARVPTHLKVGDVDHRPPGPPAPVALPPHAPRPFRPGSANRIRIDPSSLHTQQLRTPTPHKLKRPVSSSSASRMFPDHGPGCFFLCVMKKNVNHDLLVLPAMSRVTYSIT